MPATPSEPNAVEPIAEPVMEEPSVAPSRSRAPWLAATLGSAALVAVAMWMGLRAEPQVEAEVDPPHGQAEPRPPSRPAPPAPPRDDPPDGVEPPEAPRTVRVDLRGVPAGATVTVDGRALAAGAPIELERDEREHELSVSAPGRETWRRSHRADEDGVYEVELPRPRTASRRGGIAQAPAGPETAPPVEPTAGAPHAPVQAGELASDPGF